MREGDASSPVLFNVYHSTAMEIAGERRKRSGHENPGIAWEWIPGNSLPPKDTTRASGNSTTETIRVTEILFADDTQLAGHDKELDGTEEDEGGKEITTKALEKFEEMCHEDKEEHKTLGHRDEIRVLGSYSDRTTDVKKRLERMRKQSFSVRRWLKRSKIPRTVQAKVVEATVESTGLFDCGIRPWNAREIKKLQSEVDKIYRHIWSNKKKPPLKEMQEKKMNMYAVRRELKVGSLAKKIEMRSLTRIGHVLRMDNKRLTKQVTLGWPASEIKGWRKRQNQTTISYWRKILRNADMDPDTIGLKANNKKNYMKALRNRERHIEQWEEAMAEREELERSQWKKPTETTCEECGKICATVGGLKNHITRMHKKNRMSENKCNKCETNFRTKSSLENHQKVCKGTAPDTCPHCNQKQSRGNLSRHINKCKMKESSNRQNNMNTNEGVLGNLPLKRGISVKTGTNGRARNAAYVEQGS